MTKHQSILYTAGAALVAGALLISGTALAAGPSHTPFLNAFFNSDGHFSLSDNHALSPTDQKAVVGTVTAINGTTLSVSSKNERSFPFFNGPKDATSTVTIYTVNAANASITNGPGANAATTTLSSVKVGDKLIVRGTIDGTAIAAASIADLGVTPTPPVQPAKAFIFGTISAINGSSLTVSGKTFGASATTTYTVDASSAKFWKIGDGFKPSGENLSNVTVGDHVLIIGTLSGTSITASSVIDGTFTKKPHPSEKKNDSDKGSVKGTVSGILGTTLTVNAAASKKTENAAATYSVDASNAKIYAGAKGDEHTQASLANVETGDSIKARGTVNGTNVAATLIHDFTKH